MSKTTTNLIDLNATDFTILIIDDNPTNLGVAVDYLEDFGFNILVSQDGEGGLKRAQYAHPDLILLDVMMPGIDGFETCRRLKASELTCKIPVIFMTALSDTEDKIKGFAVGAVDYVVKPIQQEELLARIGVHLKLQHLSQTLEQKNLLLAQFNHNLEQQVMERTAQLTETLEQLKQSQLQLVQSEKMSTLGNLIAGIAHEINNPIGFISGNLQHAQGYVQDLLRLINFYQKYYPEPIAEIQAEIDEIDLDYLREDLPKLLESMDIGSERILDISKSLRTLSRSDRDFQQPFDVHEGIDSTLLILKHRLKATDRRPAIEVKRIYADLPPIHCFPGQLNQVFMNLLANAIDALDEVNQRSQDEIKINPNRIVIETAQHGDSIYIKISDNGIGIKQEVQQRIFDYLFSTKPAGQGTGLGLAIAHQIIVEQHKGQLKCTSTPGKGTEFTIELFLKI